MMRRLAVFFTATMLFSVLVAIPASATHDFTVTITVDGTATLNQFKTILTLTGTYNCMETDGGIDQDHSGIGGQVLQEQKGGKVIVHNGFGFGPFTCDGTTRTWSSDVQAHVGDVPAVWKRGRVLVNGGGNVCNTDCIDVDGDSFLRSVKITH